MPVVTVVVPAFNSERWIAESLSSVVAQSYPRESLEIVVVDDGCTDATVAAADRVLQESGIAYSVVRNSSSKGPSAARNQGWRSGRGDWVQFLDADDRLEHTKIALQAQAAQSAVPSVAALHSPWARLMLRGERWVSASPWVQPAIGEDPLIDLLRADNFMQLGCLLFSRKWLEKVNGFDESIRLIEDVELLLRLTICGGALQAVPSAQPLSWYRQHPRSLSRSDDHGFVDGCVRNARLVERHWRDAATLTPARRRALAGIYYMGAHFFAGRDPDAFNDLVEQLYRLEPKFVPEGPRALRILTRLFGYQRAERCAVQYRRFKRSILPQPGA